VRIAACLTEVRALLERAASLQGDAPALRQPRGLTFAELEDIAAEAQIDVALLRRAALELDTASALQPTTIGGRLAGAPLRRHTDYVLPFEASEAALGVLVDTIGSITTETGESRLIGRTFTWHAAASTGRHTDVRVTVRGGTTHIRVEERYSELAGGLFGGILGGVGGGVGIGGGIAVASVLGSAALMVAIPAAVIACSYATCRAGFTAYVRHRSRQLDELTDQIAHELTALHERDKP
jgi:hypothetical protein